MTKSNKLLEGLTDDNRKIILLASKRLDMHPSDLINYLLTKNVEAIEEMYKRKKN